MLLYKVQDLEGIPTDPIYHKTSIMVPIACSTGSVL